MKTTLHTLLVLGIAGASSAFGQVVFSDNMAGTFSTNWTSQTTSTSGAAVFSSGVLLLDNGSTAGQTWAYTSTASFAAPYNPILANNTGVVEWAVNMRTLTTNPSNSNRFAFVIAASSSDFAGASTSGYAVRVGGDSPSTDPFELVYFSGGVNGTITTIASGASFTSNQYGSVRITYDPTTNGWSLFGSTDTSWSDPLAIGTQLGSTTINSTGVGISLAYTGFWSLHTTGAAQDRSFDNLTISVVPEPSAFAAVAGLAALGGAALRRKRRAALAG